MVGLYGGAMQRIVIRYQPVDIFLGLGGSPLVLYNLLKQALRSLYRRGRVWFRYQKMIRPCV